jgi:hypothetical protein
MLTSSSPWPVTTRGVGRLMPKFQNTDRELLWVRYFEPDDTPAMFVVNDDIAVPPVVTKS